MIIISDSCDLPLPRVWGGRCCWPPASGPTGIYVKSHCNLSTSRELEITNVGRQSTLNPCGDSGQHLKAAGKPRVTTVALRVRGFPTPELSLGQLGLNCSG